MSALTEASVPTDVITMGETMALMKAATPGPLAHAGSLGLGMGGAESNFAIALKRLGTSVTWLGRVGQDSLGDLVLREIAAEGIATLGIRDPGAPTALMIKERRTLEHLKVWYYRAGSAGSRLSPEDVPVRTIQNAKLLHLTGITPALSESASEAALYAVSVARAAGVSVSFDLNYRAALWTHDEAGPVFRTFIEQADIVFAGDDEAGIAVGAGGDSLGLAHKIAALGPRQVIIKNGPRGCTALINGAEYRQEAVPINAVDTVGAGDAFVAGYIADLLAGAPIEDRLRTAVRTGAFACLVPGDWEGMPRRHELGLLDTTEPVTR
ncbi:2-dehydro-3-deoxygluconokinase [Paenarthrobacter nicotinovorans]|uniref:sugar kinase n=1 Tax=Micrococcaceae TaxID=1268 RepID=UPI0008769355|nr:MULTISPECIES: sugar kinase [Micrococcaceae]MDR6438980.1 2-dehydro-3-deoxygluconokinase [Paenarthrobacter nicotinovorans]SCZ63707.1 2-dehydro-3-deoxygluconokinase [Arthrobacter sp. UNCCL28]